MQIDVAPRRRRSVSLTPLIDVVFNLLLFFMLASSLTRWNGLDLATGVQSADADTTPPAEVLVLEGGALRYADRSMSLEQLVERLKQAQQAGEVDAVILRAEDNVRLGALIERFDQLNHAGIDALALGEATP